MKNQIQPRAAGDAAQNPAVTVQAEGLSIHGTHVDLSYTVKPGTLADLVIHPGTFRTLADVARAFGLGICLTASLHWQGGAYITLED